MIGSVSHSNPFAFAQQTGVSAQRDRTDGAEEERDDVSAAGRITDEQPSKDKKETVTADEQQQVAELRQRDAEVRAHENAHLGAAGPHSRGGVSFEYQTGPDGRQYAVGGHVNIDTSEGRTPEETIRKMQTVIAAAMAPAEPSGQDRAVAAAAAQKLAAAQQQLAEEKTQKTAPSKDAPETDDSDNPGKEAASDENSARSLIASEYASARAPTGMFVRAVA